MPRDTELQPAPTILVIDEDRCIRLMLAEVLRCAGYSTLLVPCPAEATAATLGHRVDLIIADVGPPQVHSSLRELIAAMTARAQIADVPLVLLTSVGRPLKACELAGLNVQLILSHPLSTRELLFGIAQLLDAPSASRREAA